MDSKGGMSENRNKVGKLFLDSCPRLLFSVLQVHTICCLSTVVKTYFSVSPPSKNPLNKQSETIKIKRKTSVCNINKNQAFFGAYFVKGLIS